MESFLRKLSNKNIMILSSLLIHIVNKISNFFVYLPNPQYGNRAEDVLNCFVHCKNFNKKPVIIYLVDIFFFRSLNLPNVIRRIINILSVPQQNNALCNIENKLLGKQNKLIKFFFILILNIEFYILRLVYFFFLVIFRFFFKKNCTHIIKLFNQKSIGELCFFKEFKKNKILGYSSNELSKIKKEWYFPQFKNIDEEKKYIFNKLKIKNKKDWYVAFHARSNFYYNEKLPSVRNINFKDYIPAIKQINIMGGYSAKVGADKPLKYKIKGLIDSFNINISKKKEIDDLLIIKHCKFIICGSSGPMEVATIFNKPVISINIPYLLMCSWFTKGSVLISPKIYDLYKKKFLNRYEKIKLINETSYIDTLENTKRYKVMPVEAKLIKKIIYNTIKFKIKNTKKNKKINSFYKEQIRERIFDDAKNHMFYNDFVKYKKFEKKRMLARITGTIHGVVF